MAKKIKRILKNLFREAKGKETDSYLKLTISGIVVIGLIMLSSASAIVAYNSYGDAYYFLKRQLVFFVIGSICFYLVSKFDYHKLKKFSFLMLAISIILLVIVFVPSLMREVGGAKSWISFSGFSLQPSELVKLTFLIYLSAWFAGRKERSRNTDASQKTVPFLIILGIISLLMIFQPDIGTLFIITASALTVYFVGGGKVKYIIGLLLVGSVLLTALVSVNTYQQNRFRCVVEPTFSPQDHCYQINQSLIAIGSGGFFGRGLGESRQKYLYLPEVQNDFIFSIIAEEMGFIFCVLVLLLFLLLFFRGYTIARNTEDNFGKNLSIGIVTWLTIQAILNIGGIINLLPMTGVPLPLMSYGGSSVISAMIALGILANISKQAK